MEDKIMKDLHRIRKNYAAKFDYDLEAIKNDIYKKQELSGVKYVQYPPKTISIKVPKTSAR
jgi:hypothetical protein